MAEYKFNESPIISIKLTIPKNGPWLAADCTIDSDTPVNTGDKVSITFIDRVFSGTVLDTGIFQGFLRCTIIGGTGNMADLIDSRSYRGLPAGQLFRDIANLTGHELSTTSDKDVLDFVLERWDKLKSRGSDLIEKILEVTGGTWRVLPDGTLWVGKPVVNALDINKFIIIEKIPEDSRWSIYNEENLIEPYSSLDGSVIERVEYSFEDGGELLCNVYFTNTFGDAITAMAEQSKDILYNKIYRCRVVQQKQDDMVDLLPDPSVAELANGITDVPILTPFPGMRILVPKNTHCFLMFANGDARYPRVLAWESAVVDTGINSTKVEMITSGGKAAARKGDACGSLIFSPGMSGATLTYDPTSAAGIKLVVQEGSSIVSIGT